MSLINLELISFKIAFTLCALSTAGYLLSLLIKKIKLAKFSTWILAGAFGFLTVNLLFVVINSNGLVNFRPRDFFSFCAWSVCGAYLALQFKTKTRSLGAFISPFILLFMIAAAGASFGQISSAGKFAKLADCRAFVFDNCRGGIVYSRFLRRSHVHNSKQTAET